MSTKDKTCEPLELTFKSAEHYMNFLSLRESLLNERGLFFAHGLQNYANPDMNKVNIVVYNIITSRMVA